MDPEYSSEFEVVQPDPAALIESLRAFGYTLEASVADIIDNSIVADATRIDLQFSWRGEHSTVVIMDDGCGMTEAELINAMRLGSRNPIDDRAPSDLGRFGLGLKTASLSHCRKLTVGSKARGHSVAIHAWDLDYVQSSGEWRLRKRTPDYADGLFSSLENRDSGTVVLWEQMDRLVQGAAADDERRENLFYEQIDNVKRHLAMVFHRFLETKGLLKIFINGRPLEAWDPFLKNHPATQKLPEEPLHLSGSRIIVSPFVLPHRSKMDDGTYERAGGPGGWNARQGFYIYRNRRLIVAGSWLGLGFRKEAHTKLARILVDIPNSMDADWKIDVRKSVAHPPALLREDFKRIARLTIDRATAVYRHRGKLVQRHTAEDFVFPWNTSVCRNAYSYSINRRHPLVENVLTSSGVMKGRIESMLRLIEETVPVQTIVLEGARNPDRLHKPFEEHPSEDLIALMKEVWHCMIESGITATEANRRLMVMEPFSDYTAEISAFVESRETEV